MIYGVEYVGQTTQTLETRFSQHANCKPSSIGKAIRKYGRDKFTKKILAVCNSKAEPDAKEIRFIIELKANNPEIRAQKKFVIKYRRRKLAKKIQCLAHTIRPNIALKFRLNCALTVHSKI